MPRLTTTNNLSYYVRLRRAQKVTESGGAKVLIKDVEQELANYCFMSLEGIRAIKLGKVQPSLHVAMRIADFFGVKVEDIFKLVIIEENDEKELQEKKEGVKENGQKEV